MPTGERISVLVFHCLSLQGSPEERPLKVLKEPAHAEILLESKALNSEHGLFNHTWDKGKKARMFGGTSLCALWGQRGCCWCSQVFQWSRKQKLIPRQKRTEIHPSPLKSLYKAAFYRTFLATVPLRTILPYRDNAGSANWLYAQQSAAECAQGVSPASCQAGEQCLGLQQESSPSKREKTATSESPLLPLALCSRSGDVMSCVTLSNCLITCLGVICLQIQWVHNSKNWFYPTWF